MNAENAIMKDTAELMTTVVGLIGEGHTVWLPLRGWSMRPFLEHERDQALLSQPANITIGDIVLAEVSKNRYVLHRLVRMDGEEVTLLGDGNLKPEHCQLSDIRAKAIGFRRKGREKVDRPEEMKWRLYAAYWMRQPLIVRRCLLAAYRRIAKWT